ncbi:MAG: lipopolysaccharide heptosyltransferase I [Nitrospiraceae bacterium]|nr:lipopolysaccharide heptosyltransferase I [Nitrospiraceae bacterium]
MLVVKPSSLGDVIHSLPFLYSIKAQMPGLRVHWVITEELAPLLEGHLLIERLWKIKKDGWKMPGRILETASELAALSKALRKEEFDAVLDLQGLLRSALITRMAGARTTIGFKNPREPAAGLFYAHRVHASWKQHAVERYLKMAEFAGFKTRVEFPLPEMEGFEPPLEKYALIAPGARWPSKRWPARRFGELAGGLELDSLVIGAAGDAGLAEEVASHSGGKAIPFAGKSSLKMLVELIRRASFMVTNDSGPMHIAAALGVPVFAVFGPTDPAHTGPYGNGTRVVIRGRTGCSPCRRRTCRSMRCMDEISVRMVREEMEKALHPAALFP